jgi:hypothetical protein
MTSLSPETKSLESWRANEDLWDLAAIQNDVLASLARLGEHAPRALSAGAQVVVRSMCAGYPLVCDHELATAVGGLSADAQAKYLSAMARGPAAIMGEVEASVSSVVLRPQDHPNLWHSVKNKRGRDGSGSDFSVPAKTLRFNYRNASDHHGIRFTIYSDLKDRLDFAGGERIPFPALAETLVKLAFPGRDDAEFTWFTPSEKRGNDNGVIEEGTHNESPT